MTKEIMEYMKQVSKETDIPTLESLEILKVQGKDIYDYTSHLPKLRNKTNGDIAIPKARNTLGILIYKILAPDSSDSLKKTNPVLSFIELSTIATYVLDDIIDLQKERQKDRSTWVRYGVNKGIIAGGIQTFLAMTELKKLHLTAENNLKLYELANNMWLKLWIGEGFNEEMRVNTTVKEYIERCYNISGVMYETVAQMSAICASASEHNFELASEIGKNYGIAAMIRNDLIDLLPDFREHSSALSKKPHEDLNKGICTYPIIHAFQRANDHEKAVITNTLGNDKHDKEMFYSILKKYVSFQATLDLITRYKAKVMSAVYKLPESGSRELLLQFTELLENLRKYV